MSKQKERYVVWIHVKPYVKKYLLNNFRVWDKQWSELVNLSGDRELNTFISGRLAKPQHRYDKRIDAQVAGKVRIAFEISATQFYRYGWALSLTDEHELCRALEIRCETLCKTFLSSTYMYIGNLNECIRLFYKTFNMTEEDWSIDAIRKMWQRDKLLPKININSLNFVKSTQFILAQMSNNGTITEKVKKNYEKNLV